jgi:hypothetical protein
MSDADKSLDILIKLKADAAGGKQAEQALDSLKNKTASVTASNISAHQKEQAAILAKLAAVEGATKKAQSPNRNAQDNFGKIYEGFLTNKEFGTARGNQFLNIAAGMNQTGAAAATASPKVGGLSMAITRIARAMGMQGIRGGAQLFTMIGGAVTLAYIAFEKLSEVIKQIADDDTPQLESLVHVMENVREKTYEAEAAQRAYYRELERLKNLPENEAERARVRMQYIQEVARFEQDMAGQTYRRDLAMLQAVEDAGLISHQEALRRKYAMDEEYNQRKLALELKEEEDALEAKKTRWKEADAKRQVNEGKMKVAAKTQFGTQEREETAREKLAQLEHGREKAEDTIKSLTDEQREAKDKFTIYNPLDPGGYMGAANIERLEKRIKREQENLTKLNVGIESGKKEVHSTAEENALAKEALDPLKQEAMRVAQELRGLVIEIKHDEDSTRRHKQELTAAAEAAKKAKDADLVEAKAKEEHAAGIGVGSDRSALRYEPASKRAWDRLSPFQKQSAPTPTIEFDPNKVDAATGLPVNPGQKRNLQTWEPGAQEQYDKNRFGPGGARPNVHYTQIVDYENEGKKAANQIEQALAKLAAANNKNSAALISTAEQSLMVALKHQQDIETIKKRIADLHNK